jgi:hypothetical protein
MTRDYNAALAIQRAVIDPAVVRAESDKRDPLLPKSLRAQASSELALLAKLTVVIARALAKAAAAQAEATDDA